MKPRGYVEPRGGHFEPNVQMTGAILDWGGVIYNVYTGSKLSPSPLSFFIADMPRSTAPVKLEASLNGYLEEIIAYRQDNSMMMSVPKSSAMLLTPNTHQAIGCKQIPVSITCTQKLNAEGEGTLGATISAVFGKMSRAR